MLDQRPILHRSLVGAGAFAFVFAAAMSGTAFMMSGGFDLSDEQPNFSHRSAELVNVVQDTWSDWAAPQAQARPIAASLSDETPDEPYVEPQGPNADALDGDVGQQAAATTRPEDWVDQNADVQYAAGETSDDGGAGAGASASDEDKTKDSVSF